MRDVDQLRCTVLHSELTHARTAGGTHAAGVCVRTQVLSVVLCVIALIFLLARGEDFRHALGFVVVLLVASIPIAIEIVRCAPSSLNASYRHPELSGHCRY